MAIKQGGAQKVQAQTGALLGTGTGAIVQADANNGIIAKYDANTGVRGGQGVVVKTSADSDRVAGVILNVSRANVTSTSEPSLDPRGTAPGGSTCLLGTAGNFLLTFDAAVPAAQVGRAVTLSGTNAGQVIADAAPGTKTIVGHVIAADGLVVNGRQVALVRLIPV